MGCPEASDCIDLELDDHGALQPSWIFAPESNVSCGPAGLISPKLLRAPACAAVGDANIAPSLGGFTSQFGPVLTLANPSATRPMIADVSILFGTRQIRVHNGADITVVDLVGIAATGGLNIASYEPVETSEWRDHPTFAGGSEVAFNGSAVTRWSCPLSIAAGASIDVTFERRVGMAGDAASYGDVTLRTTFMFVTGIVV